MSIASIAYIAGLLDGEGYIRLRFRNQHKTQRVKDKVYPHNNKFYVLEVRIVNRNLDCLLLCQSLFGGRICSIDGEDGTKKANLWILEGKKKVLSFLQTVRPYVIIKKPHIEAILNNLKNQDYASRLLRILNKKGCKETKGNLPLI